MSEKIEAFWQDATAEDVARVMSGETMEARFRDSEAEPWTSVRTLRGWSDGKWVSVLCWNHCQVYREPSWHADKPDPGPGWRLLGKFPDEPKLATDEAWSGRRWLPIAEDNGIQQDCTWYRRRIEVEPEPNHYILRVGYTATLPNGQTITATEKGFEVTR